MSTVFPSLKNQFQIIETIQVRLVKTVLVRSLKQFRSDH
jgi:hypothetical protein